MSLFSDSELIMKLQTFFGFVVYEVLINYYCFRNTITAESFFLLTLCSRAHSFCALLFSNQGIAGL